MYFRHVYAPQKNNRASQKKPCSSRHAGKIWCRYGAFAPQFFGYGATAARLHRNFFVFLPRCLVEDGSPGGRKEDMAQLWRVCTISSLLFWLAYTLNQTGSFAVALYRPTMVCS